MPAAAERMTAGEDSVVASPGVAVNKPCTRTAMTIGMAERALRMCFPLRLRRSGDLQIVDSQRSPREADQKRVIVVVGRVEETLRILKQWMLGAEEAVFQAR